MFLIYLLQNLINFISFIKRESLFCSYTLFSYNCLKKKNVLFLIPYFLIGYDILRDAVYGIINREPFDENFLMAVATVGAMLLGENVEGVAVMLFYQTGELFQSVKIVVKN